MRRAWICEDGEVCKLTALYILEFCLVMYPIIVQEQVFDALQTAQEAKWL